MGVIIVSAKDSLDDKVYGLEIGADDYLPKPFHLAELSMRIYAIIRRKEFAANNLLRSNSIEINLPAKSVSVKEQPVVLTRTEYELLMVTEGSIKRNRTNRIDLSPLLAIGDRQRTLEKLATTYTIRHGGSA